MRENVFISYSHTDKKWLDLVVKSLTPIVRSRDNIKVWDDTKISPGSEWRTEIQSAIHSAKVAVLLVTPDFLSSEFIAQHELPRLLNAAKSNGLEIIWIAVRHSSYRETEIERYQAANNPTKPLANQTPNGREKTLVEICDKIKGAIDRVTDLKGTDKPAVPITSRWQRAYETRRPIFDLIAPSYLLDHTFHFLDWNPVFDEIIAKPLGLSPGDHASVFVAGLKNRDDVIERAKSVFGPHQDPLVDLELLEFESPSYGLMKFQKFAAQIPDEHGNIRAWSVNLNILGTDDGAKEKQLWEDMKNKLRGAVNWSKYAESYDRLLLRFGEYRRLVELVTGKLGAAKVCADLGAGTGNATLKLLKDVQEREVWAIESNETMIEHLRAKVEESDSGGAGLKDRLFIVKHDIMNLSKFENEFFDGALMLNVLYAVEDRQKCLQEVARTLKPGGILAISTSNNETNVQKLFTAIRQDLVDQGLFTELRENWEDALHRHEAMDELIHRDTKEDIRRYLTTAGFQIKDWHDSEYVDAVVVAKAVKV